MGGRLHSWWLKFQIARTERLRATHADAEVLRVLFGDNAYFEARRRSNNEPAVDAKHWRAVVARIAQTTGRIVGLGTTTRMSGRDD
jgi:hypothetical protein